MLDRIDALLFVGAWVYVYAVHSAEPAVRVGENESPSSPSREVAEPSQGPGPRPEITDPRAELTGGGRRRNEAAKLSEG